MSHSTSPSSDGRADNGLTDRVLARIEQVPLERRKGDSATDVDALRRVFLEFGESYRGYRRRTGEPVSAEVRDAARRFRRELDLVSLVSVAAVLERVNGGLVT